MVGILLAHGASPVMKGVKDKRSVTVVMAAHEDNLSTLLNTMPEKKAIAAAKKRGATAPQMNLVNIT